MVDCIAVEVELADDTEGVEQGEADLDIALEDFWPECVMVVVEEALLVGLLGLVDEGGMDSVVVSVVDSVVSTSMSVLEKSSVV